MDKLQDTQRIDTLFKSVASLIEQARRQVVTAVNVAEVYTKNEIGRHIVEDEQKGESRAKYGKGVLKGLSARLNERFVSGWSVDTLEKCRKLYIVYSISAITQRKLTDKKTAILQRKSSTTARRNNHGKQ